MKGAEACPFIRHFITLQVKVERQITNYFRHAEVCHHSHGHGGYPVNLAHADISQKSAHNYASSLNCALLCLWIDSNCKLSVQKIKWPMEGPGQQVSKHKR